MKTIMITDGGLSDSDRRDLAWVLGLLDEWLLCAEPSTIRELDRHLRSTGRQASSATVLTRLGELRRGLDSGVVDSTGD